MVFQCLATHLRIVSNTLIYRYSILCSSVSSSIASHTSDRMCRAVDVVSIVDDPIFMWTVTFNTPLLHLMALSNILFDKQSGYKRNSDRFIRWISLLFDCSIFVFFALAVCVCVRVFVLVPRVISSIPFIDKVFVFVSGSGSGSVYIIFIKFNKIVLLTNSNVVHAHKYADIICFWSFLSTR